MDIFMKRFDCDDATKAFGNIWWDVTFIIHTNIFIFIIRQFDEKSCKLGSNFVLEIMVIRIVLIQYKTWSQN